jgi:hypothetical protein
LVGIGVWCDVFVFMMGSTWLISWDWLLVAYRWRNSLLWRERRRNSHLVRMNK